MKFKTIINDFISDKEYVKIEKLSKESNIHPFSEMLFFEYPSQRIINFHKAFEIIFNRDSDWLLSIKKRLLDTSDYSNSLSAIGEIYAYGAFIKNKIDIKPIKTKSIPTPDFGYTVSVSGKKEALKKTVYIEVHSKQIPLAERAKLDSRKKDRNSMSCNSIHVIHPGGAPDSAKEGKDRENSRVNLISKLCNIKSNETQFKTGKNCVNILWLNLQNEIWDMLSLKENCNYLYESHENCYSSGTNWYAFYGEKDLPVFENNTSKHESYSQKYQMNHSGRFKKSNLSAVIISLSDATVIYQNPNKFLDIEVLRTLNKLPLINNRLSSYSSNQNKIARYVEEKIVELRAKESELIYSFG